MRGGVTGALGLASQSRRGTADSLGFVLQIVLQGYGFQALMIGYPPASIIIEAGSNHVYADIDSGIGSLAPLDRRRNATQ
jgi:hypothetical protein